LKLGEEEFWEGTSWSEFAALTERWDQRHTLENYRAGLAPAAVLNLFLPRHRQKAPLDFFRIKKTRRRQTPEEMFQAMESLTLLALGGRDLRKENGDDR